MLRLVFGLVLVPLLLIETAMVQEHPVTGWAAINVAIFPLLALASLAIHEAGHALAARAVGLDLVRIELGIGRRRARWRWGRTTLQLNSFPTFGVTVVGAEQPHRLRLRLWTMIVAGPLATLALGAVALAAADRSLGAALWPSDLVAREVAPLALLACTNLWMLAVNLLPLPLLPGFSTDGAQLVSVPFASAARLRALATMRALFDAEELREVGRLDDAERLLRAALARVPGDWAVRNSLALIALDSGRLVEARDAFRALIAEPPAEPKLLFVARSNLAWTNYVLADDALRAEADEHSAAALAGLGRVGFVLSTRGAVLGWLGRHDEAVALQRQAHLIASAANQRASLAARLAISLAALGQLDDARAWLARAEAEEPNDVLLPRARAAVAAGGGSST